MSENVRAPRELLLGVALIDEMTQEERPVLSSISKGMTRAVSSGGSAVSISNNNTLNGRQSGDSMGRGRRQAI